MVSGSAGSGASRRRSRAASSRMWQRPRSSTRVRALEPDLLVSWFWTTRLPMSLVGAARFGGIGVHPSLLPRHRGPDPTSWAIAAATPRPGVTVHRLEEDYDTGAILAQARLTIDPTWNAWNLARALDRPSLRLLRETVASPGAWGGSGRGAAGRVGGDRGAVRGGRGHLDRVVVAHRARLAPRSGARSGPRGGDGDRRRWRDGASCRRGFAIPCRSRAGRGRGRGRVAARPHRRRGDRLARGRDSRGPGRTRRGRGPPGRGRRSSPPSFSRACAWW